MRTLITLLLNTASVLSCTRTTERITLPCHPVSMPLHFRGDGVVEIFVSEPGLVRLVKAELDTTLRIDSALHVLIAGADWFHIPLHTYTGSRYAPIAIDKSISLQTVESLLLELRKAGVLSIQLKGCDKQHHELMLPPFMPNGTEYIHPDRLRMLPPPPPMPSIDVLQDGSTIIAVLHPGQPRYETGTGELVTDLGQHILLQHEKVWLLYRPVESSTYDDLFRFYSEVRNIIEMVRGPQEPDSVYLEMRRRYPMRIIRYPEHPLEWENGVDTVDVRH